MNWAELGYLRMAAQEAGVPAPLLLASAPVAAVASRRASVEQRMMFESPACVCGLMGSKEGSDRALISGCSVSLPSNQWAGLVPTT